MKSKILIVLSLLVIAALAVPLGLMTAAILRGESPRQLAEKEQMAEGLPDEEQEPDVSEPAVPQAGRAARSRTGSPGRDGSWGRAGT